VTRSHLAMAAACLVSLLSGCAPKPPPENIPAYPSMDAPSSLRTLAERARQVQSLSGEGLITLTRPDGQSVRLDAAIAMRPPERARIRAWKFGRAIFDLTVTPDGVWVLSPDDPQRREQIRSAGVGAAQLARTWSLLSGGFFEQPDLKTELQDSRRLLVHRDVPGEPTVLCEVDRQTLTPRRYSLLDDRGATRFTLTLDRYQTFGATVWPTRLVATSDGGIVEVQLRQVDVNPDLPPTAFTPPRRAERMP
jgi:outer membrane lipoprotein-sorting protein